jgi:hypothetical protein
VGQEVNLEEWDNGYKHKDEHEWMNMGKFNNGEFREMGNG